MIKLNKLRNLFMSNNYKMWKSCVNTSVFLCVINANFRVKHLSVFIKNVKNSTYSPTFSHHSTTFPTAHSYLYQPNIFHFYTEPTNTTTTIIN